MPMAEHSSCSRGCACEPLWNQRANDALQRTGRATGPRDCSVADVIHASAAQTSPSFCVRVMRSMNLAALGQSVKGHPQVVIMTANPVNAGGSIKECADHAESLDLGLR